MSGMEWILELALVGLLLATVFHAVRLERALGVLKRDRAALEALVAGFNESTRAAEQGIARLRETAEGAGRDLARQSESAQRLRDDLAFLAERGGTLADRLEALVRGGRALDATGKTPSPPAGPRHLRAVDEEADEGATTAARAPRSQAERDLMRALRLAR
jgi:hypothetical protein